MPQDTPLSFSRSEFDTRLAKTRTAMAERGLEDDWGLEITESILITATGVETLSNTPRKLFVKE